jgi:hypothetical protein
LVAEEQPVRVDTERDGKVSSKPVHGTGRHRRRKRGESKAARPLQAARAVENQAPPREQPAPVVRETATGRPPARAIDTQSPWQR